MELSSLSPGLSGGWENDLGFKKILTQSYLRKNVKCILRDIFTKFSD